jgi:hypothetical protein
VPIQFPEGIKQTYRQAKRAYGQKYKGQHIRIITYQNMNWRFRGQDIGKAIGNIDNKVKADEYQQDEKITFYYIF